MFGQPEVILSFQNHTGLRLFGYRKPPSSITAPDVERFGTVLDVGPLEFNGSPVTGDLFGGIMATERPQVRVVFRNTGNQWGVWAGKEVILHQLMGIHLWYGGLNFFPDFAGEILRFDPQKDECVIEFGEGRLLYEVIKLARADIYPKPRNRAEILPVLYGDFVSQGVNSFPENSGGMTPCPCIDVDNNVFLVSNSRCLVGAPARFWINETEQPEFTPTGQRVWTYVPDGDYAGLGLRIAYVQFHGVVDGEVSCRVMGTMDDLNGQLITEPIHAITHFLMSKGTWTANDFDPYTTPQAAVAMAGKNYTVHYCFNEDKHAKDWLAEYFKHFWVDTIVTADSKLAFLVDLVPPPPERVLASIDVRADIGGDEPEREVRCNIDSQNLTNSVTVKGRYSWVSGKYTGEVPIKDEASIRLHQRIADYLAELPGVRTTEHAVSWVGHLNGRTTFMPTAITLPMRHMKFPWLMPGTNFGLSWRQAPIEGGWTATRPRIMLTRNNHRQYPNPLIGREGKVTLEVIDTGYNFRRTSYFPMIDNHGLVHYVYVNESGTLITDPGIPAMDTLTLTPWRWISRQAPNGTTWFFYLMKNTDGSYLRFEISDVSPGGVGSSDTALEVANRIYQGWKLRADDVPVAQLTGTTF